MNVTEILCNLGDEATFVSIVTCIGDL
jgi:hypothetical protein